MQQFIACSHLRFTIDVYNPERNAHLQQRTISNQNEPNLDFVCQHMIRMLLHDITAYSFVNTSLLCCAMISLLICLSTHHHYVAPRYHCLFWCQHIIIMLLHDHSLSSRETMDGTENQDRGVALDQWYVAFT